MVDENDRGAAELVRPDRRFDLRAAFLLRQEQLLATLGVGRAIGGHPVAVGDSAELNWRGMLQSILPARYRVSKAFVVDADGNRSDQIDLLIYDRHYSPVLVDVGEYLFIPAEATYAVLEIKQVMNKETVLYTAEKLASVRRLRRTSAPIPYAGGTLQGRQPPDIVGGLLSMDGGWSGGLAAPFMETLRNVPDGGALDLGCALKAGSFEASAVDGRIEIAGPDTALIFFILRLLKRLQGMATVPAIIYEDYASVLADGDERSPE